MKSRIIFVLIIIIGIHADRAHSSCGHPEDMPNSTNNATGAETYNENDVIEYDCDVGYRRYGYHIYTCINGQWSYGWLTCNQIFCSDVKVPENGKRVGNYDRTVASVAEFACKPGYDLVGTNAMLCRANGEWRPSSPPTCEPKYCGDFGGVENGETFQTSLNGRYDRYENVVYVTCDENYILIGQSRVKCSANGQWESKPRCEFSSCQQHPGLNSSCIYDTFLSDDGTVLTLLCEENSDNVSVTEVGSGIAFCNYGEWDELDTACYCDCKIDTRSQNFSATGLVNGFLKHDETLQWTCISGYLKNTHEAIRCTDGNLNLQPLCLPVPVTTTSTTTTTTTTATTTTTTETTTTSNAWRSTSKTESTKRTTTASNTVIKKGNKDSDSSDSHSDASDNHSDSSDSHSDASDSHSDFSDSHSDASDSHSDFSDSHSDASDSHSDSSDSHSDASDNHSDSSDSHSDASDSHSDSSDSHSDASDSHSDSSDSHSDASDSHSDSSDSHSDASDSHSDSSDRHSDASDSHSDSSGSHSDSSGSHSDSSDGHSDSSDSHSDSSDSHSDSSDSHSASSDGPSDSSDSHSDSSDSHSDYSDSNSVSSDGHSASSDGHSASSSNDRMISDTTDKKNKKTIKIVGHRTGSSSKVRSNCSTTLFSIVMCSCMLVLWY